LKTSLDIIAAILLSLGVLSPNLIRIVGSKICEFLNTEPKSSIMKSAKYQVIKPDTVEKHIEACFIHLTIALVTYLFALFLVSIMYIAFGIWLAFSSKGLFFYPISIFSIIIGFICGVCFLQELGLVKKDFPGDRYFISFFKITYADKLAVFSIFAVGKVLSVFTMGIPYLWYRALKEIHARGVSWAATVLGLILFVMRLLM